jgi:hypothetical protein
MYSKVPQMPSAAIYIFKNVGGGRTPQTPLPKRSVPPQLEIKDPPLQIKTHVPPWVKYSWGICVHINGAHVIIAN